MSKKNIKISSPVALNPKNQIFVDEFAKLVNLIQTESTLTTDSKIKQTNTFRIANLKKNMISIGKFKVQIISPAQLHGLPGFGKGTIERIGEILQKGYLQEVKDLYKQYANQSSRNQLIEELEQIIGIGKVIAIELIDKYQIKSLKDLKTRVKEGTIQVNDKIKLGLKYEGKFETKIPRKIVTRIYDLIYDVGKTTNSNLIVGVCGSYRRGLPQSSDIDILVCDMDILFKEQIEKSNSLSKFVNSLKKAKIITDDITSQGVKSKYMGFCNYGKNNYRIDIRLVPLESYYPALVYFTGSYQLNTQMRQTAKKLGYKLNEYGLYNIKTGESILITSEEHLFELLKIKYLEPEERNI